MVHVCKVSGPQIDLQLPPETVFPAFFYRGTAMAEFQHVNCMIE